MHNKEKNHRNFFISAKFNVGTVHYYSTTVKKFISAIYFYNYKANCTSVKSFHNGDGQFTPKPDGSAIHSNVRDLDLHTTTNLVGASLMALSLFFHPSQMMVSQWSSAATALLRDKIACGEINPNQDS